MSHHHWKGRMVWGGFSWWVWRSTLSLANNPTGCLMALVLCLSASYVIGSDMPTVSEFLIVINATQTALAATMR